MEMRLCDISFGSEFKNTQNMWCGLQKDLAITLNKTSRSDEWTHRVPFSASAVDFSVPDTVKGKMTGKIMSSNHLYHVMMGKVVNVFQPLMSKWPWDQ